jgi:hypothetical protein
MSSGTSTERVLPSTSGSHGAVTDARDTTDSRDVATQADPKAASFSVPHFFVLVSLVGATAAVLMSRANSPEHLVLMSATIGAAGAAAAGLYRMLAPLARDEQALETQPVNERLRADLAREKALVLRSIKELEFDRAMGKVSSQDFEDMAARLRSRAIGLMKQLDEGGAAYRTLIERELQVRLRRGPTAAAAAARVTGTCACGTSNDADANFCKRCGAALR